MVDQAFMQAWMWPLISQVKVVTPPKMAQFGVWDDIIQRTSYWGIMEITGSHPEFMRLIHNMHSGTTISSNLQHDILTWGSMKVDLAHEEFIILN